MDLKGIIVISLFSIVLISSAPAINFAHACRVNSQLLESYARKTVERLLDPEQFAALYWPDEPLPASSLSKATGINVTLVETHFLFADVDNHITGRRSKPTNATSSLTNEKQRRRTYRHHPSNKLQSVPKGSLIQEIFVTCSVDRDRSYALVVNLELDNPFEVIDVYYMTPPQLQVENGGGIDNNTTQSQLQGEQQQATPRTGLFRIRLPQSSLLVQLNQRIRYDECLSVNYVQLSPTVNYEIECVDCYGRDQAQLDKIFNRRISQLDVELDAILSEKVLFGLQVLLNQQRIDLDMYLE